MAKQTAKETPSPELPTKSANVPINTNFTGDVFRRLETMRKKEGLLFCQEIIRAAVSYYLEKKGY